MIEFEDAEGMQRRLILVKEGIGRGPLGVPRYFVKVYDLLDDSSQAVEVTFRTCYKALADRKNRNKKPKDYFVPAFGNGEPERGVC